MTPKKKAPVVRITLAGLHFVNDVSMFNHDFGREPELKGGKGPRMRLRLLHRDVAGHHFTIRWNGERNRLEYVQEGPPKATYLVDRYNPKLGNREPRKGAVSSLQSRDNFKSISLPGGNMIFLERPDSKT